MAEILSMGGLMFLLVNGPFAFFLMRFADKIHDPEYEEKIFSRMKGKKQ